MEMLYDPIRMLIVEETPGNVRLTQEVLRDDKVRNNMRVAKDGVEAVAFLRRTGAPRPDIILLDPNLPRGEQDGR